ncbi:hypothetical protein [Agrobacterium sp. Azo12]|uniref:PD-(D/E)XK nuclease domain-containing protein n=1 Tax=Agrobacterium sp. Azo12 TaxID=3031129 RepID=UPI0023D83CE7|nr:hypothetical protein [Agrobacterium sp. Azo12]MDO5897903.1 hypothetical protein [Agrobacterium sp. Azo12]
MSPKKRNSEKHSGPWEIVNSSLAACRKQVSRCELVQYPGEDANGNLICSEEQEQETEYLKYLIEKAYVQLQLLIEKNGCLKYLDRFNDGFDEFDNLSDVMPNKYFPEQLESPALLYLESAFSSFTEMVVGLDSNTTELSILERILQNTPYIVKDYGNDPHSEKDIRATLLAFLSHLFPDVMREVAIPHVHKTYKADLAIPSLKAVVEVKYAHNSQELKQELDGIYSDMKGYSGDARWTHFFALIYTTEPLMSQSKLDAEYALARVDVMWKAIVVHGAGDRQRPIKVSKSGKI